MEDYQGQLKVALQDYFRAIELQKESDVSLRPSLKDQFIRLDKLASQLPRDCNPQLKHYMVQKSYEKALNFLSGESHLNADGSCSR
jgi:hypothetical protein